MYSKNFESCCEFTELSDAIVPITTNNATTPEDIVFMQYNLEEKYLLNSNCSNDFNSPLFFMFILYFLDWNDELVRVLTLSKK